MTPRMIVVGTLALALGAGLATPAVAMAGDETKRVCVALSNDPERQTYAPICVWVPIQR